MSRFWCCMLLAACALGLSELSAVRALQPPRILDPPVSRNVSLGTSVKLNCTVAAKFISWYVDDEWVGFGHVKDELDLQPTVTAINTTRNIRKGTLLARKSLLINNSKIVCRATTKHLYNESEAIFVRVQGLLESVSNLDVIAINSTAILITWTAPFTLEGVPILGYNVTITNTSSGENETMLVEGDTTMLYYSINRRDPDNRFTVSVVPINEVGAGEVSSPRNFVFPTFLEPSVTGVSSAPVPQNTNSIGGSGQTSTYLPTSSAYYNFNSASSRNGPESTHGPIIQPSTMAVYTGVPIFLIFILVCAIAVVLLTVILCRRKKNREVIGLIGSPSPEHVVHNKGSGHSPPHSQIALNLSAIDTSSPIPCKHETCSFGKTRDTTFAITINCSTTTIEAPECASNEQHHGELPEVVVEEEQTESSSLLSAQGYTQESRCEYSDDDEAPSSLPTPKPEVSRPKSLFRSKSCDAQPVCRTYVNIEKKSSNDYTGANSPIKQVAVKLGFVRKGSLQLIKEESLTKGLSEEEETLPEEYFRPSFHNKASDNN